MTWRKGEGYHRNRRRGGAGAGSTVPPGMGGVVSLSLKTYAQSLWQAMCQYTYIQLRLNACLENIFV